MSERPEHDILFACDACGTMTPLDLLDAKPTPGDEANWERFECQACYGPGWESGTEVFQMAQRSQITP